MMIVNEECFAAGRGKRIMNQDCDATFGDPDSPIFVREGDKFGVGALNVAVGSRGGKSLVIAIFLPKGAVN